MLLRGSGAEFLDQLSQGWPFARRKLAVGQVVDLMTTCIAEHFAAHVSAPGPCSRGGIRGVTECILIRPINSARPT